MQAYSQDLRERVAAAAALPHRSQDQVAAQFGVRVSLVANLHQGQRLRGLAAPRNGPWPRWRAARTPPGPNSKPGAPARAYPPLARPPYAAYWRTTAGAVTKSAPASQRATPRVCARRRAFLAAVATEDVRWVKFVDETGTNLSYPRPYGRALPGPRVGQGRALRSGGNVTVVGALTPNGLEAVMELDGALNEAAFSTYLDQVPGPTLHPGDVVVLDKLGVHKMAGMAERVAAYGARLRFLPPYSPDFNPIALAGSKLKTALRTAQARTRQALSDALTHACNWITKTAAQNWFAHCGYQVH